MKGKLFCELFCKAMALHTTAELDLKQFLSN
jgi:hypothetical protein